MRKRYPTFNNLCAKRGESLENLLDWGINVVFWFQQFSPRLDLVFKGFTFLGNEAFFLILMPLLYWSFDRRIGARVLILFLFSAYLNSTVKVLADQPRPFSYDPRINQMVPAEGGGFPSGHTQGAVVVWGYLAISLKNKWIWIIAGVLMIGIPLSRIYLGVHFPSDIFGGYVLGAFLLYLFIRLDPWAEKWLSQKGLHWQLGLTLFLPFLLILLSPGGDQASLIAGSTLMGFATGIALERRWIGFCAGGIWWKRVLRYLVGLVVLCGLWMGLRLGLKGFEPASLFRIIRYAVTGLWCSLGAPWAFAKLRLTATQ